MLTTYRRHSQRCPHRHEGRKYRRCRCPLWADGTLDGEEIRKSLGLRNWEKAQTLIRKWEAEGPPEEEPEPPIGVKEACDDFIREAEARELCESTVKKYRQLAKQMKAFADDTGRPHLQEWNLSVLRKFRSSWRDGPNSARKKLERLKALFRFAQDTGWITENPAAKLKPPSEKPAPTMPFAQEEVIRILAACDRYRDSRGRTGQPNAKRLRGLVLLLRYAGLRIGDATSCPVDRLQGDKLFLYTHKTGTPVYLKLPAFVVEALRSIPRTSERYWFWSGAGKIDNNTETWRRRLNRLFELAGVKGGHPHRFRDTFSVELLLAGVPIEQVAVLLGHSSVRITEKHYSPWVRARQERLDADLERAWAKDPVAFSQTKGTPEVHGKHEAVN